MAKREPYAAWVKTHPLEYLEQMLPPMTDCPTDAAFMNRWNEVCGRANALADLGVISFEQRREFGHKLNAIRAERMLGWMVAPIEEVTA